MYTIRVKRMQQTPRGVDGRANPGAKRLRASQAAFEDDSIPGRSATLHPTKGWRTRNLERLKNYGNMTMLLDFLSHQREKKNE